MSWWIGLPVYTGMLMLVSVGMGLLPLWHRGRGQVLSGLVGFGAGTLLGTALLNMIPKATALVATPLALGGAVLAGFLTVYLAEHLFMVHACGEDECEVHGVGWAAFLGLSLHSFIDGVALGAGLEASTALGFMVFFAILMHKAPAALTLASVMLHDRYSPRSVIAALVAFALTVPVGALVGVGLGGLNERALGLAIAFSAGTFLEVSAGDLLPQVHRSGPRRHTELLWFLLGIAIAAGVALVDGT